MLKSRVEPNRLLQIGVLKQRSHAIDRGLVQPESTCLIAPAGNGRANDAKGALGFARGRAKILPSAMAISREAVGSPTPIDVCRMRFLM